MTIITNEDVATGEAGGTGKARIMVSNFTTRVQGIIHARASKNVNRHKGKGHMNNTPRNPKGVYHRSGGNRHWACTYRTPKHLVDSIKPLSRRRMSKPISLTRLNQWIYLIQCSIYQGN